MAAGKQRGAQQRVSGALAVARQRRGCGRKLRRERLERR